MSDTKKPEQRKMKSSINLHKETRQTMARMQLIFQPSRSAWLALEKSGYKVFLSQPTERLRTC